MPTNKYSLKPKSDEIFVGLEAGTKENLLRKTIGIFNIRHLETYLEKLGFGNHYEGLRSKAFI